MYRFIGKSDEFIPGVPRRALTNQEWDALEATSRKLAENSGLYRFSKDPKESAAEKERGDNNGG